MHAVCVTTSPTCHRRRRRRRPPPPPSHCFPGQTQPPRPSSSSQPPTHLIAKTNSLLSSSAKTKPLPHTLTLFHLIPGCLRDTVTWNTVISACLRHRHHRDVLRLFHDMLLLSHSSPPDNITMLAALKACVACDDALLGFQLHGYVTKLEGVGAFERSVMGTWMVDMYAGLGCFELAHQMFERIPERDAVAFTSMMAACNRAGDHRKALLTFVEMTRESDCLTANEYAFSCALRAAAGAALFAVGKQIHGHVVKASLRSDGYVGTSLVDMYTKCGDNERADMAFQEIHEKNVAAWNARMSGNSDGKEVLEMLLQMRLCGVKPDHVTFASVLRASGSFGLCFHRQIHCFVMKSREAEIDVFIGEALFAAYINHGWINEAWRIFSQIKDKDIVAFNVAIESCSRNGYTEVAVDLLHEALQTQKEVNEATVISLMHGFKEVNQGKQLHAVAVKLGFTGGSPYTHISSSLVKMYSDHNCIDDAIKVFEQIDAPDLALWTSMISCFSVNGRSQEALLLYKRMLSEGPREPPNHFTLSTLAGACANCVAMEEGKQVHAQIIKSISYTEIDQFIATGLLNMYAKCGYIQEARRIFNGMPQRDLPSWNAMITNLAEHGLAEEALKTFDQLVKYENMKPNNVTFLGALSACNHCGMVEEGFKIFRLIETPTMNHYACLIDLVARAGQLEEARDLIKEMPFQPNERMWSSILGACSIHGDIELGEYSAKQLLALNPKDPGTYIALSNLFASAGRWNDVEHTRKLMKEQVSRKTPGHSWLVVDGRTHSFFANNQRKHDLVDSTEDL